MTGRWNEVEPILDAALAHEPHERAAFVAQACAGDYALRREVESLLAQEPVAKGLLSTPGFVLEAESLEAQAIIGRTIGPYTIQSLLGAGGMGEVYRAHDVQLDRDVAIKINKAFPTSGAGTPVTLCYACEIDWTPDGRSLIVRFFPGDGPSRETLIMPLAPGTSLPSFPAEGFRSKADLAGLPARDVNGWVYPDSTGSTYVFARTSTQRNIYRIALR